MARTITEIFNIQKAEAVRLATEENNVEMLDMLQNTSRFALWRIMFSVMAFVVWTLEVLWDKFLILVNTIIAELVPHSLRWYRKKALSFQFGFDLLPESDKYNNSGFTNAQIEESKVVKYAAVNEATIDGRRVLLVKVAGVDGSGNLVQLSALVEAAFIAYFEIIKDAGNFIVVYNRVADSLKTTVDVYYNPLLLDNTGNRLDGLGNKPVEDAARSFLLDLPFNGEFSNAAFVDKLQAAYGVADRKVFLTSLLRKIGIGSYQSVSSVFIPEAGYTQFEELTINYIANV